MALNKKSYPVNYYTSGRPWGIKRIVVHHMAGVLTAKRCADVLNSRGVSAHYGIGSDGVVGVYVAEGNRAWHSGDGVNKNSKGNDCGIGIETANSATGGNWPVSDKTFNILVELCYDIAKRNNLLPLVVGQTLCWHSMFQATACPGDYLRSKMDELARRVNEMATPTPTPANISYEGITAKTVVINKDTSLWDFNFTKWSEAQAVKNYKKGDKVDVVAIAHNKTVNADYYMTAWSYNNGTIRATNGFNVKDCDDYVAPTPEPTPTPTPTPEPTPEPEPTPVPVDPVEPDVTIDDYNEIIEKANETVELAEEAIKKFGIKFTMSNKVYDVLKVIAVTVLPLISFLYVGLANIWGFGFGEQVDATIQLIIAAINTILGAVVLKSSADYKKNA